MIGAYTVFLAVVWKKLPDTVPSHFNAAGTPDAYGGKAVLLLEPILAILIFALIAFVRRIPSAWNFPVRVTDRNRDRLYAIGNTMMDILLPLTVFLMLYIGLMSILTLPVVVLYPALAAMLLDIVISIVRMVRMRDPGDADNSGRFY